MATWQYRAWLVPSSRVTNGKEAARRILEDEDVDLWEDIAPGWVEVVARVLGLPLWDESWSPHLHSWGAGDGTNVSEWVEDGHLLEVSCAIDARDLEVTQVERLAATLKQLDAVLVDADGNCTPPERDAILQVISRSHAGRFVADPIAFLDELARKPKKEH